MPWFIRVPVLHVDAITLWFVVLYKGTLTEQTARHEIIHFRQYNELFVFGFLALYLWDWLKAFMQLRSFWGAYRRIRFEQEAFAHQGEVAYLDTRARNAWREYAVQSITCEDKALTDNLD